MINNYSTLEGYFFTGGREIPPLRISLLTRIRQRQRYVYRFIYNDL